MAEVAKGIIDIEINTGSAASQLKSLQAQINAFNLALNKGSKIQGAYAAEYAKELQIAINRTGAFTAEAVRLNTAAATLDKTLSKGKTSLGQFFSAKFNKDSAVAAEVMALAAERARRMQTQFIATSAAANGMQEALAIRPMAQFSSEMAVTAQKSQILASMFRQGTTQLINFGKNVQWAGRQLMVGFTVPLTIFGNTAGRTFMELEKQLISFKKVYGDIFTTPAELDKNLQAVTNLAQEYTKYGIAVKDTIGLAAQAAAAGRKNADLTDAVAQATRLATLGQMDQNAALETTISLQSAFRLSGQELADTINFLNMVENQTVVSLQDLSAAIPRVAPVIQGLGGDVKDLSVFLAAMQEGGVDAAEGANALKSGLASLINPTKQATQMLSGMGINLQSIIDANKGDLMATVMAFSQALASLDQFSRQQALEQVFGKFQYAKLGALFENISREGSQAQQVIATMGYTTEQLGATADKELKTIEQSFGVQLTGAVERFKLAIAPIGELFVKMAIPIVNFLTGIVEKFNGLSEGKKQFIAIATVITGVLIPAGTMLFGLLMNLTGTLLKMSQGFGAFAKGLITGGPIGAIKALTQSSKYLNLAEIDAAMAAQQLSVASEAVNIALQEQAVSARMAETAIDSLVQTYMALISTQNAAARMQGFAVPGAAANAAKNIRTGGSGFRVRRSLGGSIPGTGSQDTIPAMLTPGEFVVNKEATRRSYGLLKAINDGTIQGFNGGGLLALRNIGLAALNKKKSGFQSQQFINIVPAANVARSGSSKGHVTLEQMRALLPGFKGSGSLYQAKGTAGIYIGDIADPSILKKYPELVANGVISRARINSLLSKGGLPPELMRAAALASGGKNISSTGQFLNALGKYGVIDSKDAKRISSLVESSYFDAIRKKVKVTDTDNPLWEISDDIIKKNLSGNKAALEFWNDFSKQVGVFNNETRQSLGLAGRSGGSTTARKIVLTNSDGVSISIGRLSGSKTENSLFAHTASPTPFMSQLEDVRQFASGGTVPGSGNTDTVPAMLTPGEFVVNKDASRKNMGLLKGINNGNINGYALGGIVGGLGMAAAIGGQFMPNQNVGNVMSVAGMMAPMIFGQGGSGAIANVAKGIVSKLGFLGGAIGMSAGAIAALGFGAYKLNKNLAKAEKAGAELTKAMYGSADRTRAVGEAFGRESRADIARRIAVEKAGGQQISQESQQQSSQFMQSDAGKQLVADIKLVKSEGKNAVEALRNQLASSIVSGVISTEEAKAIALDIGKELNDQQLSVSVSGELTKLLGVDGKDMLKNISSITAKITPKIDKNQLSREAQYAFNELNVLQKFGQSIMRGGQQGFISNYIAEDISAANASAFEVEAQALSLLNAAYQEGTIKLTDYESKKKDIITQSLKQQNANARILGFENQQAIESGVTLTRRTKPLGGSELVYTGDKNKVKIINEQRDAVKELFKTYSGGSETAANAMIESSAKLGPSIWGKIMRGEVDIQDLEVLIKLKDGGMSQEDLDNISNKLMTIRNTSPISSVIDVSTLGEQQINSLYSAIEKIDKIDSPITKEIFIKTTGSDFLNDAQMKAFLALPAETQKTIMINFEYNVNSPKDTKAFREGYQTAQGAAEAQAIRDILNPITPPTGNGGNNQGGGSGATDWKKNLENRFDLIDKRLSLEAQKYQDVVKLQERQNELDQRNIESNQKALDQLTKQESAINDAYQSRISALDGVAKANERVKQQEQSRISLATALASGDIAAAASTMSEMSATKTANQIEDTRAALELQRETDLKNLKVEINGELVTREQIQARIDAIEENIYQRNLKIREAQDSIYVLEQQRTANAREREKVETRLFLIEQRKAIVALKGNKIGKSWTKQDAADLAEFKNSYNSTVDFFNATFGENLQKVMYGGRIKKFAFGNVVPGMGNTDRVPALLTPGEFVVRKSVAQANMPLLERLNSGLLSGPSYSVPKTDFGVQASSMQQNTGIVYNDTYSINVNVAGTNASPDDIANVVLNRLSQFGSGNVRGIRY